MHRLLAGLGFVAAVALAPAPVAAQCADGKLAVLMTTPSGRQKTICVSDAAVQGIESAADNSAGTVVPSICPCWTAEEVRTLVASSPYGVLCQTLSYDGTYVCHTLGPVGKEQLVYVIDPTVGASACVNYVSRVSEALKPEALTACRAILDGNIPPPSCPCWTPSDLQRLADAGKLACGISGLSYDCGSVSLDTSARSCASDNLGVPETSLTTLQVIGCQMALGPYLP